MQKYLDSEERAAPVEASVVEPPAGPESQGGAPLDKRDRNARVGGVFTSRVALLPKLWANTRHSTLKTIAQNYNAKT